VAKSKCGSFIVSCCLSIPFTESFAGHRYEYISYRDRAFSTRPVHKKDAEVVQTIETMELR
jgi:hypothetical protein